jgi:hypothetical protein
VLTDEHGSPEVESLYLARYRRMLQSEVQANTQPLVPMASAESPVKPLAQRNGGIHEHSGGGPGER